MRKLIIADTDQDLVRELEKGIDWGSFGVEVAGKAFGARQLRSEMAALRPDMVLAGAGLIERGDVVEVFNTDREGFENILEGLKNEAGGVSNGELSAVLEKRGMDVNDCFYVGICVGICPDEATRLYRQSFGEYNLTCFSVINHLTHTFGERKTGVPVKTERSVLYIVGVFSNDDRGNFIEDYIEPVRRQVEEECGVGICVGIGSPAANPADMLQSYKESKVAFELYHFNEQKITDFSKIHREYNVSFEDYKEDVELAFRSIITKNEDALAKIDRIMDDIESIHYANWNAVVMRTMHFTGDLGSMLNQYHLLDVDFYDMQDELQAKVEEQFTMASLKRCIHEHYEDLIARIYAKGRSQDKVLIEDVKKYIRDHYNEDLSIKELSSVACVSQNYFSAMFKKETGQNYKAYLTSIRMEEALRLLQETDFKTYEIGERVGYNNVRRFVDAFKQIYSVSPMEYKKGLKK